MKFIFHEESFILAEKTQSAGIANSLTGDTLQELAEKSVSKTTYLIIHFEDYYHCKTLYLHSFFKKIRNSFLTSNFLFYASYVKTCEAVNQIRFTQNICVVEKN